MGGIFHHLTSRGAIILGVAALAGIGYFYAGNFRASTAVDARIANLRTQVNELHQEEVKLNELLKYFDSEAYAEQKARLEFGLAKPGESVVVVSSLPVTETVERQSPPANNLVRWWRYFFGKTEL